MLCLFDRTYYVSRIQIVIGGKMIELALLRAIKHRSDWDKVKHYVSSDAIDEHTRGIVATVSKYWDVASEVTDVVDMDTLRSMFYADKPTMTDDTKRIYDELFSRMCVDLTPHEQAVIVNNLIEKDLAVKLANGVNDYEGGSELNLIEWAYQVAEESRNKMTLVTESSFATIGSLIQRNQSNISYAWSLQCMANAFNNMAGSKFSILAGLSDIGKTSFALNIAVSWARQTQSPIIWLNNEGEQNDVLMRAYTIMFGVDDDTIREWSYDGTLYKKLHESFGREDPIRIYNVHKMDVRQVEELITKVHAHVGVGGVFFDMIDSIEMYVANSQAREDQRLEKKYQWARALGVQFDYPTIAMSQQSETQEYLQWPSKKHLKDSKVGKQGASDNIIFITQPEDDTVQNIRYISAPKNKTARKGSQRLRAEVKFDRTTGILYDH